MMISASLGNKIVRAIAKVNLWLAAIGLATIVLYVWGFRQAVSFLPSHLSPDEFNLMKTAFYSEWITSGILMLAQAYTGWRLLRGGAHGIRGAVVVFCGLILYFLLVCGFGTWGGGSRTVHALVFGQPGMVLDWEMVTGYPAAGAILLFCVWRSSEEPGQRNEHLLTSASRMQVLGLLGWANIILASISLCAIFWKIWAYLQLQSFVAVSSIANGVRGQYKTTLYLSSMVGIALFLLQAYTGWRLVRKDVRIIQTCIVIFSLEILYFAAVWGYGTYFRLGQVLTLLTTRHPGFVLDLQMIAGYPAAGIALLYCFQKLRVGGSQNFAH